MNITQLLDAMWKDYIELNPKALEIYKLFSADNQKVQNDHVAFRTFNHPKVNIDKFASVFTKLGYIKKDNYSFEQKKLNAFHYEHTDPTLPKIFVSELLLEEFSSSLQSTVNSLLENLSVDDISKDNFCISGRHWDLSYKTYNQLKKESEYAAWLSAYGFRVNHFTVFVNALTKFSDLQELNTFIKYHGHILNDSGGEIKGSAQALLEQSSTVAYNQNVQFSDGIYEIPACYYEFAKRYESAPGVLFQGFIAKSADKIFESTNKGQ